MWTAAIGTDPHEVRRSKHLHVCRCTFFSPILQWEYTIHYRISVGITFKACTEKNSNAHYNILQLSFFHISMEHVFQVQQVLFYCNLISALLIIVQSLHCQQSGCWAFELSEQENWLACVFCASWITHCALCTWLVSLKLKWTSAIISGAAF